MELAKIVIRHGPEYLDAFGDRLLPSHRRALEDVAACRTEQMGGHVAECDVCGHQRYAYHSCKNRSCPKCHTADTRQWLAQREAQLLPVPYFHLVFTLPATLRVVVRRHQTLLYGCLMQAAAEALLALGLNPKYVGGKLGILAVLHTWTRTLEFHPHVHLLVPAGGLAPDGSWRPARKTFLVPVRALSASFRGRFMKLATKALPEESWSPAVWDQPWVVYCKPTFRTTKKVLRYLGRYVHRCAITNRRILRLDHGNVTFSYQQNTTSAWKTMTLAAGEFLRRFLQHVLPAGFHKIRYYGLLSPRNRITVKRLQLLLEERRPHHCEPAADPEPTRPDTVERCPCCEVGAMVIITWLPRRARSPPAPRLP